MESLYGKNPKRITCRCNGEETNDDVVTIYLNNRCPICNESYQVCVPKLKVKAKELQQVA